MSAVATLEVRPQTQEVGSEFFENRPILIAGAGSGLGEVLARRFSREGYQVIAGMRNPEHFEALKEVITQEGGVEPRPFLADITDTEQVRKALDGLNLSPAVKLHFFPVAAGGIEGIKLPLAKQIVGMRRVVRGGGQVTREMAEQATKAIKHIATHPDVIRAALAINVRAPVSFLQLLNERGHVDKKTNVLNTSSSISDGVNLPYFNEYLGPWFYYAVAITKKMGVHGLRKNLNSMGVSDHLDTVAPELPDTDVGKMIDGMVEVLQTIDPDNKIEIPKVSRVVVADAIYSELTDPLNGYGGYRTLYVDESGSGYTRPVAWDKPFLPYL